MFSDEMKLMQKEHKNSQKIPKYLKIKLHTPKIKKFGREPELRKLSSIAVWWCHRAAAGGLVSYFTSSTVNSSAHTVDSGEDK